LTGAADNAAREEQWNNLLERQRELEDNSLALGGQRFRRRVAEATQAGKASTVGAARKLLQLAIEPLEAGINRLIEDSSSKRGPKHEALKWCKLLGADVAAYMTVKIVLDGVKPDGFMRTEELNFQRAAKRLPLREAALEISQLILDELRYRKFQTEAPGLFNYRMGKFTTSSYAHMARSMNAAMKYADVDVSDVDMTPQKRIQVGTKLIDLLVETTHIVEVVRRVTPQKSKRGRVTNELFVSPTQETLKWLCQRNDALEFLSPIAMPMVVPPLPWGPGVSGGYRFAMRNKWSLVRKAKPDHQKVIARTEIPVVYEAINRIQDTAWRINKAVLELVETIQQKGSAMAGVPAYEDDPLPPKPLDIDTNEDARKKWRRAAHAVRELNHLRAVRAVEHMKVLSAARGVMPEGAIYFPYNLDFRGRVYPISNYLSPQGSDLSRALLTFADAKPLGSDGARWLAIHGANCLGDTPEGEKISKMTFADRVDWIERRSDDICRVASDPLTHVWWEKADKPLQFYAFCMEWSRFIASGRSESFVSGLPIAQDGSCNGLQHFSALLRDEVGGMTVNLIPQDTPQDIYQRIADKVLDKLEERAQWSWFAARWLSSGLVTRKLTKRPTMTFGYGSKKFGFRSQIIEYLMGLDNWHEVKALFTEDDKHLVGDAAYLMSELIWDSLRETVVAAADAMAWMQDAVRKIVVTGKAVQWRVPATGFPVEQAYFVSTSKCVETVLAGRVVQPRIYADTNQIELHKQVNSVAPNVVHSLDAAALMLTVQRAAAEGVEAFGMIHDSYATVPGDCSVLAQATRQSFVRLYTSNNVIGSLYSQFMGQMTNPQDCPAPPRLGDLDVSAVLASEYFFA
jgi:DNA-directed RNA polymerase